MMCDAFTRWLDDGSPESNRAVALLHVQQCPRCATELAAAERLERVLGAAPPAPDGFAARVMARVAVTAQQRPLVPTLDTFLLAPALPWWVRAAFEPACVLAAVLAAALLWRGPALLALTVSAAAQLVMWLAPAPGASTSAWLDSATLAGAGLAAAPLVFMGSQQLYRWSATLVGPRPMRQRAR